MDSSKCRAYGYIVHFCEHLLLLYNILAKNLKIYYLFLLAFVLESNSQNVSVEKTIFGFQTGFAGIWIQNETKLSNFLVLRSEIGIENDFAVGNHYEDAGFILQPTINIEPRFYYNLNRRKLNGKSISKNSGNYFSLKANYHPDWFVINLDENVQEIADLSIIPTWGIRRQIGNHFTYETGIGVGYRIVYLKSKYADYDSNRNQYTPYFHIRIGYTF